MNPFIDKLRELSGQLTTRQKVQLGVALVATLVLVYGMSLYATRVRYGVLFSHLEPGDAAAVMSSLRDQNVEYRLSAGGTVIEVPIEQVDELRLALAGEGLPPGGGVGFEIFDKPAFGLSDFVQNVNYRRALERELSRTIQSLDVVDSARVHLALPPDTLFVDEKQEPSASVVMHLRSAGSLPAANVRAISNLVASGVEGLDAANVSIIDQDGRMLSSDGTAEDGAMSSSQLEAKRAMEKSIETTLVSILDPIVGPGRSRARATVELNMTRIERVEETYDPNVAVVRSEEKSKSRQGGASSGGIPGTASNLPGGAAPGGSAPAAGGESQTSMTNFELNKTISTIAQPVGNLARQSVAVVVDNVTEAPADEGVEPVVRQRTAEEMQQITDLVRAAIGIDESRGDVLTVTNLPFDQKAFPGATAPGGGMDWGMLLRVARYASLPLAVVLLALLVIRPGITALRSLRASSESAADGTPRTVAQLQAQLQADLARGSLPPAMTEGASPLRRKLIEAASEDPKAAALVIRNWLSSRNQNRG